MTNFSGLSLLAHRQAFINARRNTRSSMESLKNKAGDYYEHHQHLINVYSEIIETLDVAIKDAEYIGQGV